MPNQDSGDQQPLLTSRFVFIPPSPPPVSPKHDHYKGIKRGFSTHRRELIISPGAERSLDRKRKSRPLHPSSNQREGVDHRNPPLVPSRAPAWTNEIGQSRKREPPAGVYTRAPMGLARPREILKGNGEGERERYKERKKIGDHTNDLKTEASKLAKFQREQEEKKARGEEGHATRWEGRWRGNAEDNEFRGSGSRNAPRRSERSRRSETLPPVRSVTERESQKNSIRNKVDEAGDNRKSANKQQAQSSEGEPTRGRSRNRSLSQEPDRSITSGNAQQVQSFALRAMSVGAETMKSFKEKSGSAIISQMDKFEHSKPQKSNRAEDREGQITQKTAVEQEKSARESNTEEKKSQRIVASEQEKRLQRRTTTGSLDTVKGAQSAMVDKAGSKAADKALAVSMQTYEVQAEESNKRSRKTAERQRLTEQANSLKRSAAFGSTPHRTNSVPTTPIKTLARPGLSSRNQRRQTVDTIAQEGKPESFIASVQRATNRILKAAAQNKTSAGTRRGTELPEDAEPRSRGISQIASKFVNSRSNTTSHEEVAAMESNAPITSKPRVQSAPAQVPRTASDSKSRKDGSQQKNSSNRITNKTNRPKELSRVEEEQVSEGKATVKTELHRKLGDGRRTEMQGVRPKSEIERASAATSNPRYSAAVSKAKTELNRGFGDGRRSEMQGVRLKSEVEDGNGVSNTSYYSMAAYKIRTKLEGGLGDGGRSDVQGVRLKSEVKHGGPAGPSESDSSVGTVLNRGFGNGGRSIFEGVRAKSEVDIERGTNQ